MRKNKVLKYKTPSVVFLNNDTENVFTTFKITEDFLINNKEYIESIDLHLESYRCLLDLMPELVWNFGSGHIFPYLESEYELESSIILAMLGFYKQAIYSLRNVLEMGLLSIYYNVEDKDHIEIKDWLHSLENTPFKKKIFEKLLKNKNILEFENKTNIFNRIETLYKELCNYTHTKGARYSSKALLRSNVNNFNEKSFIKWFNFFKQTVRIVVELHLLKYPVGLQFTPIEEKFGLNGPVGGFLNPYQVEQIKKIFDDKTLKVLQKISNEDESAIALAEEINRRPDITEEEFAKQLEENDKWQIEGMGFKNWLRNEKVLIKHLKNTNPQEYEYKIKYIKK